MSRASSTPNKFLFGAAVGAGMTALAAERGGADFIAVINAGRLRLRGASSLSCYLPLRDSNAWTLEIARQEILKRCKLPVFMGASVVNPRTEITALLDDAGQAGFQGIVNFPSAWAIDGRLRQAMEAEGIGFARECKLIEQAARAGLSTLAYVSNNQEARLMADAGADSICVVVGFTGGATGVATDLTIEGAAEVVDETLRNIPKEVKTLVEGGPITTPEEALAVSRLSRVGGYIAGSTLDRLPLEETIERVVKSYKVISQLSEQTPSEAVQGDLDGHAEAVQGVRAQATMAARSSLPVLITGESGTGKELVARAIHERSEVRARKPLVVDCPNLLAEDSPVTLFGQEAGYLSRATPLRRGRLEEANGSTIIFDEIGDLDLVAQGMLLRFIETGEVQRLGSDRLRNSRCRIIATSNRDLASMVRQKTFREDLYYRLAVIEIVVPPLRERLEDLPELCKTLLEEDFPAGGVRLANSAYSALLDHDWPGNVRELRNALLQAATASDQPLLRARDFGFLARRKLHAPMEAVDATVSATSAPPAEKADAPLTERDWIAAALRRNRYRKAQTAAELGITPRTLYNKVKKYGLG